MKHRAIELSLCLTLCTHIAAQTPNHQLVADINKAPSLASGAPEAGAYGVGGTTRHAFARLGSNWYFSAFSEAHGRELWKTNGTTAGTVMVKDIHPGVNGSHPDNLVPCNGKLYFQATDHVHGKELWCTDGTAAGTKMVRDVRVGPVGAGAQHIICFKNTLYFVAYDGSAKGNGLWKSNGTAAGTVVVKPFRTAAYLHVAPSGNWFYLQGNDAAGGAELWRSDGTTGGTTRLRDIYVGPNGSSPRMFVNTNGRTVFRATEPSGGTELWVTSGTPASTGRIADIRSGSASSNPTLGHSESVVIGKYAYFTATLATYGTSVLRTDGTAAGTQTVYRGGYPAALTAVGTKLYMRLYIRSSWSNYGYEPYYFDSVANRVVRIADIAPSSRSSYPHAFRAAGAGVTFIANDYSTGYELWHYNGSTTRRVADINPGSSSSSPSWITPIGTNKFLVTASGPKGRELYLTNGTTSAGLLKDIEPATWNRGSGPRNFTPLDGKTMLFTANDPTRGTELWSQSGSTTQLVKDIYPGANGSYPDHMTTFWNGSKMIAIFRARASDSEPWISDGTAAGTKKLKDIATGSSSSSPAFFTPAGRRVFFSAWDGTGTGQHGRELWVTEGTAATTKMVKDISPGTASSSPQQFVRCGNRVFFSAQTTTAGYELWTSDGTAAGTTMVKDIYPGTNSSSPTYLTCCNGKVVFRVRTAAGNVLWVSDGTATGTQQLLGANCNPYNLVCSGNNVFFVARNATAGNELWKTDTTPAGTMMVKDIYTGSASSSPNHLTAANGRVFFSASTAANGREPWVSDGTAAGTKLAADVDPGTRTSDPQDFIAAGGGVYFSANHQSYPNTKGRELWFSDGTPGGTKLACDVQKGDQSSYPRDPVILDGRLYFVARTHQTGEELYALTTRPATVETLGNTCGTAHPRLECTDVRIGKTAKISGYDAPTNGTRLLVIGLPSTPPLSFPSLAQNSCPIWVNIVWPIVLFPVPPTVTSWSLPVNVPNDNSLVGGRVGLQVLHDPLPALLTNGVSIQVGK